MQVTSLFDVTCMHSRTECRLFGEPRFSSSISQAQEFPRHHHSTLSSHATLRPINYLLNQQQAPVLVGWLFKITIKGWQFTCTMVYDCDDEPSIVLVACDITVLLHRYRITLHPHPICNLLPCDVLSGLTGCRMLWLTLHSFAWFEQTLLFTSNAVVVLNVSLFLVFILRRSLQDVLFPGLKKKNILELDFECVGVWTSECNLLARKQTNSVSHNPWHKSALFRKILLRISCKKSLFTT